LFHGKVLTSIDDKGRIIIPSKFRKHILSEANNLLYITHGRNDCLWLYPSNEWSLVSNKLAGLSSFGKDAINLKRMLLSSTEECQIDSNHRILIPKEHLQLAKIQKEVLMIGQLERIEIWNPNELDKYFKVNNINYEDVIDRVLEDRTSSGSEIL
jgi:MraZ protein